MKRELSVFLIVGSLTVLVDFLSYRGLLLLPIVGPEIAKAIGFVTGTVFAYFANKAWTFAQQEPRPGSAIRFVALYAVTLSLNVAVNSGLLWALPPSQTSLLAAFIFATGLSATLNFLGMKFFVFRRFAVVES